jgi:hypothetical protein
MSGYFSSDRARKYGWGLPRLALLTVAAFQLAPFASSAVPPAAAAPLALLPYLRSGRWVAHAYLGSVGAAVNVRVHPFAVNLALLLAGAALCVWDARVDNTIFVYLFKTFGGDFVAGKLDTPEWRLVLLFALLGPALALRTSGAAEAFAPYARILPLLLLVQAACELGDNHLERYVVFRHRYAFEAATAALLFCAAPTASELRVLQHDLVVCLFYRAANFGIILQHSGALWVAVRKACFLAFGLLRGTPLRNVTDAETAMAVLRASDEKGAALERFVATPAWLPLISLESVDGALYKAMMADLHTLLDALPPPAALQAIAARQVVEAAARDDAIDAEAVARLCMAAFVEYVFGVPWCVELQVLVDASWEWRKEIAVRGRADPAVKAAAVERVLALLRATPALWALFGERWAQPRYYSLIMQPFLISPAINVGDIAVAMAARPTLSLEDAIRDQHPFPIFERFVAEDVTSADGRLLVRGGTQVIVFTSDLRRGAWPVFGCGPRACAGTQLALAVLRPLHATLRAHPRFVPERGHRYSGRNNDGGFSVAETLYFIRAIVPVVLFGRAAGG